MNLPGITFATHDRPLPNLPGRAHKALVFDNGQFYLYFWNEFEGLPNKAEPRWRELDCPAEFFLSAYRFQDEMNRQNETLQELAIVREVCQAGLPLKSSIRKCASALLKR